MTEHEWLASDNPEAMLKHIRSKDLRKCRLFACAACRRISHSLTAVGLDVLDVAERFADGEATQAEIEAARPKAPGWSMAFGHTFDAGTAAAFTVELLEEMYDEASYKKNDNLVGCLFGARWAALATADLPSEWRAQSDLVRDVFGNPYRPVTVDPSWLTSAVVGLASAIYDSRAFHDMPILADALQDAGCSDEAVLAHCRGEGPHVRGCWVTDMLTNRA